MASPCLGMCLTCSKGNSLRDKVRKLRKLQFAVPYKHSQAPFSTPALICNAELSVQAKQYLDSGRELIKTLQSFVWICTTVIRWLWVKEKVFFPTFPLRLCHQRLGLTVQMTGPAALRPERFQGRDVPWWRRGPEAVASCRHGCPALFCSLTWLHISFFFNLPIYCCSKLPEKIPKSVDPELRCFPNTGYTVTVVSGTHSLKFNPVTFVRPWKLGRGFIRFPEGRIQLLEFFCYHNV